MTNKKEPEFLTPAVVARLVGLTPSSVRLAATTGKLRAALTTVDGRRLFLRADVEAWRHRTRRSKTTKA
jgi:hypothetical protein